MQVPLSSLAGANVNVACASLTYVDVVKLLLALYVPKTDSAW